MVDYADPEAYPRGVALGVEERAEPRWPASMAFLTALWRPATTARRTQHVSLGRAFGVHVLATVAACFLFCVLAAWADSGSGADRAFGVRLGRILDSIIEEYARGLNRWPLETLGMTLGIVLLIEAGFVGLALALTPWGAADERLRASFANGLRHTWLHTVDVLPVSLLVGLLAVPLSHASREWHSVGYGAMVSPGQPPQPPTPPGAVAVNSPEWQAYQKQYQAYTAQLNEYHAQMNRQWMERYNRAPWFVRYEGPMTALACVGAGAWVLWALLSAVGARRRVPVIERPPTCETCGYNLTLMPMEARCPECGEPVVNSLGPAVRPGAPWERRGELGRVQTWLSTALVAIARSAWLGRQIRVCSRVVDHRSFCALCLIPSFLAGYCMAIGFDYVQSHGRYGLARSLETPCFVAPILGILSASLALAVVLTAAGVIGLWVGVAHRRNLLPAAMQVAGYLMGLLAFFGLLSAGIAVIMFRAASEHWFAGLRLRYHVDEEFFAFLGWALPTLGLVLIYLALLYRGTREARYANR